MEKINANEPAMPYAWFDNQTTNSGLTIRQDFAARAMQGLCAFSDFSGDHVDRMAKVAVMHADALIAALNTPKTEKPQ